MLAHCTYGVKALRFDQALTLLNPKPTLPSALLPFLPSGTATTGGTQERLHACVGIF